MPVAPFENNLVIRIVDLDGNVLQVAPFNVQSADMGMPGTFDNRVDLSAIPAGWVRLELCEISMKDGSTIAMAAVMIQVR